jgi:hypothetical protein
MLNGVPIFLCKTSNVFKTSKVFYSIDNQCIENDFSVVNVKKINYDIQCLKDIQSI